MEWLNYHHLHYFWVVAKEGSIARASSVLRLAPPTIGGQVHRLEEVLGERLFEHRGRRLVLTDAGRIALRYADEIFSLGREFTDTLRGRPGGRPTRLVVGASDSLPKPILRRLLEPAFGFDQPVRVVCREDRSTEGFLQDLVAHDLDVLLTDAPAGPGTPARVFNHLLAECGTAFVASPELAAAIRRGFPHSLAGAPFLLPGASATLRRLLEQWFDATGIQPRIVAEMDDETMAEVLAEAGRGVLAVPTLIEAEMRRTRHVERVALAEDLRQRFFAISAERRIRHPVVFAICQQARLDGLAEQAPVATAPGSARGSPRSKNRRRP